MQQRFSASSRCALVGSHIQTSPAHPTRNNCGKAGPLSTLYSRRSCFSCHWYISTLRWSKTASAHTPKSVSSTRSGDSCNGKKFKRFAFRWNSATHCITEESDQNCMIFRLSCLWSWQCKHRQSAGHRPSIVGCPLTCPYLTAKVSQGLVDRWGTGIQVAKGFAYSQTFLQSVVLDNCAALIPGQTGV